MSEGRVRQSRVLSEAQVIDVIQDGMTVAVGGFINSGHPMSLVRGLIRAGKRELRVVGAASAGLEVDMLIAAGCVRQVVTPYVGAEGLASIGPAFRKSAQDGDIEIFEVDEAHFYAGMRAAAQRLPFNPWRAGVGTSFSTLNPELKEFTDPVNGELLLAIPAINVDVCLLHADCSDIYGNVQHSGNRFGDSALHAAADLTYVSVERIVPTERIRANPAATSIPGADGIVRARFGAHPFSADGHYRPDEEHLRDYLTAANEWLRSGSREELDGYLKRYLLTPVDHPSYLESIGVRHLLGLDEY
jgi:glutaconate CoA-transferase subunit A